MSKAREHRRKIIAGELYPSVSFADNPTHAVVGRSWDHGGGILSWHTHEFMAVKNAAVHNENGGAARVVTVAEARSC